MKQNKITLIKRTSPPCPQCAIMQLALEDAELSFDVIDITNEVEAIEKYSLSSVPVLLIGDATEEKPIKLNGVQPIDLIKELLED